MWAIRGRYASYGLINQAPPTTRLPACRVLFQHNQYVRSNATSLTSRLQIRTFSKKSDEVLYLFILMLILLALGLLNHSIYSSLFLPLIISCDYIYI